MKRQRGSSCGVIGPNLPLDGWGLVLRGESTGGRKEQEFDLMLVDKLRCGEQTNSI